MSNSLWPHGLQHTRLPCPSLFPGVGSESHSLIQWCHPTISFSVAPFSCSLTIKKLKWSENESEVAQSWPTLWDPMDCSLPGSSIHGIFEARVLEWVAIFFFGGPSQPRDRTLVSCIVGRCFYHLSHQGSPYKEIN